MIFLPVLPFARFLWVSGQEIKVFAPMDNARQARVPIALASVIYVYSL